MAHSFFAVRCGAYIFNNQKKLLLLKNRKGTWGLVGGHVEAGEELESALKREVKEETGLVIDIKGLLLAKKRGESVVITYAAKLKRGTVKLSHEHSDFAWVAKGDLKNFNLTFPELPSELELAKKLLRKKK